MLRCRLRAFLYAVFNEKSGQFLTLLLPQDGGIGSFWLFDLRIDLGKSFFGEKTFTLARSEFDSQCVLFHLDIK
jgi:hypothetical protein